MEIKSKKIKLIIFFFPAIFAALMLWLRINHYPIYEIIGEEDHIIEYSQFFFFLISGIISCIIAFKFWKISKIMTILFLFAALGLLGIAGEEISWGERIFNLNTPEIFDGQTNINPLGTNVQGEMNLHNFEIIHNVIGTLYLTAGIYLIFAWPLIQLIDHIFKIKGDIKKLLLLLAPPPILALYFVPTFLNFFETAKYGFPPQDYEMVEFLFSLGVLIFLVTVLKTQAQREKNQK